MKTNLMVKTTDGMTHIYAEADYSISSSGIVTVHKADRTVDTYHMSNVYCIREEKVE